MDFTQTYKQSNFLVEFSKGAQWILTAVEDRLIVRRADSFLIERSWLVESAPITHIGWSWDSEYVFGANSKSGIVNVFKITDETWNARIVAGVEGLVRVEWAPDGRSIVCFSEWGLRVTIWSLTTGSATYIQFPIHPDRGYCYRADGKYFILAERHKSKDTIGVYDIAEAYRVVKHFPVPTSCLASISLAPTGNYLAVWEGSLEYKLFIYTLAGTLQGSFSPTEDPGFGIRCVAWHPTGAYLAIGGWDDKIYILDNLTWKPVTVFEFQARVPPNVSVWREPVGWLEATHGRGFLSYERPKVTWLPTKKPDLTKPKPKIGTVQLEWNKTGSLLLARYENAPTVAHIYEFPYTLSKEINLNLTDVPRLRSILIQQQPVVQASWNPVRKGVLSLCTSTSSLYTWSDEWIGEDGEEEMAECVGIPKGSITTLFENRVIRWSPDGKGMALLDKDTFCCAFEVAYSEAQEDQ